MASTTVIIATLATFSVLGVKGISTPPEPAIGDIRLVPYTGQGLTGYFEVLIYYSNGIHKPDFGGACADSSYEEEAKVICQQMGYEYVGFQTRPSKTSVWFKHIQCKDNSISHILRCETKVASDAERNDPKVCGEDNYRFLVSCDFTKPLAPYDGQVLLCPVDSPSVSVNKSSTSYGLVGVYYEDNGATKGINQKEEQPLGSYEADAICQNMGFTGAYPGSAVTRNVDNSSFSCFSSTFQHGAWVTTDKINCEGRQKCLGCCLDYPNRGLCNDCEETHNIVIKCVFDPSQKDSGTGTHTGCKLDSGKNVGLCEVDPQKLIQDLKIALGFIATFLVLLGPCGCYCYYCSYKKYAHQHCISCIRKSPQVCCKDYKQINEDVDHNKGNEQINHPA